MRQILTTVALLALATSALANDTTAEIGTGGLIFTRSDAVAMESEDLFISQDEVRVAYTFRNTSEADVDAIVAFPMPDIEASPDINVALPEAGDNFLGFTVTVDGKPITPSLEQRAFAAEIDVTNELRANGVALYPYDEGTDALIAGKSEQLRKDWIARGLVALQTYDDGEGDKDHYAPLWKLKSSYWWRMTFPKGKAVDVRHAYKPSVGGTVGLNFVEDGKVGGDQIDWYRSTYCTDKTFENAVQKAVTAAGDNGSPYYENWISYVLTTGANWRTTIGKFKLTVDKGKPENLISFCGENVKKVGPTRFEMTAEDFYPEQDINILILTKPEEGEEQ